MHFPVIDGRRTAGELRAEAAMRFLLEAKRRGIQLMGSSRIECRAGEVTVSAQARRTVGCPSEFREREDAAA